MTKFLVKVFKRYCLLDQNTEICLQMFKKKALKKVFRNSRRNICLDALAILFGKDPEQSDCQHKARLEMAEILRMKEFIS